jgi:atypical dual specificity phosphatase
MNSGAVLSLQGFGVAFGEKVVLASVDLQVAERQVTVLLGPSGTGKSTLLRTLAGFNNANPSLRTWGEASYAGQEISEQNSPALVLQSARMMMASVLENIVHELPERRSLTPMQQRQLALRLLEDAGLQELLLRLDEPVINLSLAQQRHLTIMRLAASGTRLLCMDEPTTGLNEAEAERLLDYIVAESSRRAMLVVLHNLAHARRLAGHTVLLAGGVVQEDATGSEFFASPRSVAAKSFVRTGSCSVPAPDSVPEELDAEAPAPAPLPLAAQHYVNDSFGPRGFLWLKKGRLAGTPRPGVFHEIDYDLKALQRVGVTCLITLTERAPEVEAMRQYGIDNIWSPIPDMTAPSITQAATICKRIEKRLQKDEVLAVHCRAGLGRTGTVLAAYLIWEGAEALSALETVRRVEPRWVQSEEQVAFLEKFALSLAGRGAALRTQFLDAV